MKNKFMKFLLALTITIGSFASIGFINSNHAQAKDWVVKSNSFFLSNYHYHTGSFKNYTYSPTFRYSMATGSGRTYTTDIHTSIKTKSSGSGKIKAVLQYKSKKGWKNLKTRYVKKKGYTVLTFFDVNPKLGKKTIFRYKFINTGSKKTISYTFCAHYF
ncbi:hypothetical protein PJ311_08540 [Bacillus sp. CLL-7-23]|uniref:Uncharacterized protein n=1 Tax=Bacillus changyiensis TaxID=3004103 RepID=A0ABT4X4I3_9BACI|nr:hypothetical protein [Bacillus changyiensis]MDA7026654.1 hypothetical protein [Bacillus changyiensis]